MIELSRVYKTKIEYKLIYSALRFIKHLDNYYPDGKEIEYTYCIDRFTDRWKRNSVIKDTYNKLHRFAIAYRYNALQGTK